MIVSCHISYIVKIIFRFTFVFLLLLPLVSCGSTQQAVIHNVFSAGDFPALRSGWLEQDDILKSLVKMELTTVNGYYPIKAALMIKRPSYIRLEFIPVIGVPDFLLVSTPEKMNIFIPSKGELYSGRPTVSNLKKFLPWPIEIEDMVMIFTGIPPAFQEKNISYRGFQEKNLLLLEMKAPSGCSQMIWMSGDNKLIKIIRKNDVGEEIYTVKYIYGDDARTIPEKITISMADGKTLLSVDYADVEIEKLADLSIFRLAVPADIKEIPLE